MMMTHMMKNMKIYYRENQSTILKSEALLLF